MPGPRPTPTAILNLRGSRRAAWRDGEPKPREGRPPCPRHLSFEQKGVYAATAKILSETRVLTKADGAQLERYAILFCRWRELQRFIDKHGTTFAVKSTEEPPGGYLLFVPKENGGPYYIARYQNFAQVGEQHRVDKALRQIESEFGLTPASRTRIRVTAEGGSAGVSSFAHDRNAM